jgi:hypothetical protein
VSWGERLEEDLPSQYCLKTDRSSTIYIRQNRVQTCITQTRQRIYHHTNKRGNTSKGNNNINLYAPNVSESDVIKHTLKDLKSHVHSNRVVVGNLNSPLSTIIR